jgi:hypothetical protein
MRRTIIGFIKRPPLATAAIALAICSAVTLIYWQNDMEAIDTGLDRSLRL